LLDFIADFAADTEFLKLLTRQEDVHLAKAALELARDADPRLDFAPTLAWIDARAGKLSGPVARARSDEEVLSALAACLSGTHGLVGCAECYENPESSYINQVIERKTGLPIALSVLYMAVAERAGLTLLGVGAPVHFLTRYETIDAPLFMDCFAGGTVLTLAECITRVEDSSELTGRKAIAALDPVGPRAIVMRMLNNLKALFAKQENWRACWKVQHRLLALQPAAFHERRDWALVSLRSGRAGAAIDMLESCLESSPDNERETLESHLAEARKQLAQWN
jgi:regulator of sirC expression with transglutaminase-like and TPR domain